MALGQVHSAVGTATAAAANAPALRFETASVRPSADLQSAAVLAAILAGNRPKIGPQVEGLRAEYNHMSLGDLIANAYAVKVYQVSAPDVLTGQRFDIAAQMPKGSTTGEARQMLQALLAARFKLKVTITTEERPVLALTVGKGGPKMKLVPAPPPLDDRAELAPGQTKLDTTDGPAIFDTRASSGGLGVGTTMNMGSNGFMTLSVKIDGQNVMMHEDFRGVTMPALATMLSQIQMMTVGPGAVANGKPVVDRTGLAGNYDTELDFSLKITMGGRGSGGGGSPSVSGPGASDASTFYDSVQKMGLKLEQSKAPVEQVTVTHAEKMPTEN